MTRIVLTDWTDPFGRVIGSTVHCDQENGRPHQLCRDVTFSDSYASIINAWTKGEIVDDQRTRWAPQSAEDFARSVGATGYWRLIRGIEVAAEGLVIDWAADMKRSAQTVARVKPEYRFEVIDLADGPADQFVVPTVEPVSHAARQIAQERQRRAARHGASPLPAGGLFDETAWAQQELFA
ncbi:hypothetical protein [Brevundimonas sp.]|uniref:hypothetical protein n=1 Tax=Brevundimonas sp. TaxID=1871086 RepID=UPI002611144E|nr:hypothetical protein [Brevundimonas sp.]